MRDKRFVTEYRGGLLNREHHRQLMIWACSCSEHVLPLLGGIPDERLKIALLTAKEWANGYVSTGDAMRASVKAHAAAREYNDPVSTAVARSIGHAVATAHMADHSLGAALYALKAVRKANRSVDAERGWQNEQLPAGIRELILTGRIEKEKSFKL
jgi:hypothetical protein